MANDRRTGAGAREIGVGHRIRTPCGVVHAPGYELEAGGAISYLACGGRVAASQVEGAGNAVVTCLWCVTGHKADNLRWFKWGDGT